MKIRIIYFFFVIFFIFVFIIFYRGLNNSNLYTPNNSIKNIPELTSETLFSEKSLNSENIFNYFCCFLQKFKRYKYLYTRDEGH